MTRKRAENDQLLEQLEGFQGEKKSFDLRQRQGSANMDSRETKQPIWDPFPVVFGIFFSKGSVQMIYDKINNKS